MIKGKQLRDAFISGAHAISNNKKEVDELNVFPVPDGDTGTNMSMTMNNSLMELERMPDNVGISQVADAMASALLRGARGNSGVILSLIFRGFSKGMAGKKSAKCDDIVKALEYGVEGAYKAVMKPTEGTILTVARLASEEAKRTALSTNDEIILWSAVCEAAKVAVENTPNQLEALKRAGVVDAGGQGLL
ncbi:MAG: DAK2 domain-containing protein, partial [Clostridiales bacterium]|nr:DAK2 domain-containing protein [Clostridiales bacterium]